MKRPPTPPPLPRRRGRFTRAVPSSGQLSEKLAVLTATGSPATGISPEKKKVRIGSADEVLKELAQNALKEMKTQGFLGNESNGDAKENKKPCGHSGEDKHDCLEPGSSQEDDEDNSDAPQSPLTFLNRIGLDDPVIRRAKRRNVTLVPPPIPFAEDLVFQSSSQLSTTPSSCTTPESGSYRQRKEKSFGNVTPATAHAARCLLDLRR